MLCSCQVPIERGGGETSRQAFCLGLTAHMMMQVKVLSILAQPTRNLNTQNPPVTTKA